MNPRNYNVDVLAKGVILMARSTTTMEVSKSSAHQIETVTDSEVTRIADLAAVASRTSGEQIESDADLATYVDFARSIARNVSPEFQERVFSRAMRVYYDRPLALQRTMKMAVARRSGGDVLKAANSVFLDLGKLPTLHETKH